MPGHGEKLSRKQEAALSALLTQPTIAEAAAQVSVNESTLRRWLKDRGFQAAYREARRQVVQHTIIQVQLASGEAVETLRTIMNNPEASSSVRLNAAKAILVLVIKTVEIDDMEDRLHALEQAMNV